MTVPRSSRCSTGSRPTDTPSSWSASTAATVGVLSVADRVRSEAAPAVADLTDTTARPPVVLTGDNPRAAATMAGQVGLADVRAGLLPEGKVAAVQDLQREGHQVLLIGDGVNDAPALAAADTGVAMGGIGSDLALSSADVVIVRDDLRTLPAVLRLSRRARRVVTENLVIAATVIAVLVGWDLIGDLPLPLGVAGHEGSTILVALNGRRLLRRAEWRPTSGDRPTSRAPVAGSPPRDEHRAAPDADDRPVLQSEATWLGRLIESIVADFPHLPRAQVQGHVEYILATFAGARVRTYLPILVDRRVRRDLRSAFPPEAARRGPHASVPGPRDAERTTEHAPLAV